jgi:pyridoxamine 5'-phosphate oxidase
MDLKEVVEFANAHPVCFLSTTDGKAGHVRGMLMDSATRDGFLFAGLTGKQLSKELHEHPLIEICFYNNPAELINARQLRIRGTAEFVKDEKVTVEIGKKRAFLKDVTGRDTGTRIEPFIVRHGRAQFWTLKDAGGEDKLEWLQF